MPPLGGGIHAMAAGPIEKIPGNLTGEHSFVLSVLKKTLSAYILPGRNPVFMI
jgi:hypothetical protein